MCIANLKRCPLCGAINAIRNDECFACSWHGLFLCDRQSVCEGVAAILARCPELTAPLEAELPKIGWIERAARWLGLHRRPLDLRL
jgi:hypothetical protein